MQSVFILNAQQISGNVFIDRDGVTDNGGHWRSGEGFILSLPYNQCSALQNDEDMFFSPHFANAVVIGSARVVWECHF